MESTAEAPMEPAVHIATLGPEPSKLLSNQDLVREADGLFAGISYLNQTEQIAGNMTDDEDDDDDDEEDEWTACSMVPESEKKEPGFQMTPLLDHEEDYLLSNGGQTSLWSDDNCSSSCWDNNCCKSSQLNKTSNCPAYLLCHWIEHHGETNVKADDGVSPIWLCPVPCCGGSFVSNSDLLTHVQSCSLINTLTGFYWCNAHNNFEAEVFYNICKSSRHQKCLENKHSEEFKVLIYKFDRIWPNSEDFQPDPRLCEYCNASTEPHLYSPEVATSHMLGHHRMHLPSPRLTTLQCCNQAAISRMRDFSRSDHLVAGIFDQIYSENLTTAFSRFLDTGTISEKGIDCGCREIIWKTKPEGTTDEPIYRLSAFRWENPYIYVDGDYASLTSSPSWHDLNDITSTVQHFCDYHVKEHLETAMTTQKRVVLLNPQIRAKYKFLKHRQEMLRIVKQLKEEVEGTSNSWRYSVPTAGNMNEIRIRLINDMRTLLESLESRLYRDPSSQPPDDVHQDLQRVESLLGEFFASPEASPSLNEEIKGSVHLNEERRKLRAILGRMSQSDKPDRVQPHDKQWANLRSLRASSAVFHDHILSVIGKEGRRKCRFRQRFLMRKLRQQIKSSSNFLITGILTFRKVLQGAVPSSLEEVLAFVSLAHVMSDELWFKGEMTEPLNFHSGFPGWKAAIQSKAERDAFQELATCLWPDSSLAFSLEENPRGTIQPEIVHLFGEFDGSSVAETLQISGEFGGESFADLSFPFPQSSGLLEFPYCGEDESALPAYGSFTTGIFNQASTSLNNTNPILDTLPFFEEPLHHLLEQSHASNEFQFSDFLDIRHWENSPGQPLDATSSTLLATTDLEVEIVNHDVEDAPPEPAQPAVSSESTDDRLDCEEMEGHKSSPTVDTMTDMSSEGNLLSLLWHTAIFQIALSYMTFLCGLGDLLTFLAGSLKMRRRSTVSATSKASATEQSIPILVKVLCPLLTNHELGELKYVVGVTCVMVQKGFFACLRDLEDYVVHLGRLFALSQSSYMLLISKSLKYLRTAALESSSSTSPCNCGTIHDMYTTKDIRFREAEQAEWAARAFKGSHSQGPPMAGLSPTPDHAAGFEDSSSSDSLMSHFSSLQTWPPHTSSSSIPASSSASMLDVVCRPEAGTVAESLRCDVCANARILKYFSGPDAECNLRRHTREKHEGKTFQCPECNTSFSRLHNLRTHWKRKHKVIDMPSYLDNSTSKGRSTSYRASPY